MNCYQMPEYAAFVAKMRVNPADRVTPLVCADWLEDHGKAGHAVFVRGCCRMAELRDILDDCSRRDLSYSDPERSVPDHEVTRLVSDLRPPINRHCHEWTGGALRRFQNPTAYDWPNGFLRFWNLYPVLTPEGARLPGPAILKLESLLRRQPISDVRLTVAGDPKLATSLLESLSVAYRGVRFLCSDTVRFVAVDALEVTA